MKNIENAQTCLNFHPAVASRVHIEYSYGELPLIFPPLAAAVPPRTAASTTAAAGFLPTFPQSTSAFVLPLTSSSLSGQSLGRLECFSSSVFSVHLLALARLQLCYILGRERQRVGLALWIIILFLLCLYLTNHHIDESTHRGKAHSSSPRTQSVRTTLEMLFVI